MNFLFCDHILFQSRTWLLPVINPRWPNAYVIRSKSVVQLIHTKLDHATILITVAIIVTITVLSTVVCTVAVVSGVLRVITVANLIGFKDFGLKPGQVVDSYLVLLPRDGDQNVLTF